MQRRKPSICKTTADETGDVHPALARYFGYCLFRAACRWRENMAAMLDEFDLGVHQLGIMTVLDATNSLNQLQLGEELSIDKTSMVKLIDGLEKLGFVDRVAVPADRRAKLIQLTTLGRRRFKQIMDRRTEVEREFLSVLSADEQALMRSALPKLLRLT